MTDEQRAMIAALERCTMSPGSWDKRFSRDLFFQAKADPKMELSPRQEWALRRTYYRYRRQHHHPDMAKPDDYDSPPVVEKVKQPDGNVIVCVRPSVSNAMAEELERLKAWNEGKAR